MGNKHKLGGAQSYQAGNVTEIENNNHITWHPKKEKCTLRLVEFKDFFCSQSLDEEDD